MIQPSPNPLLRVCYSSSMQKSGAPQRIIFFFSALFILVSGCVPSLHKNPMQMGNPASIHCVKKGGQLVIEKNSMGSEYGVCLFDSNRQCEEWALFRGDCPVGGVRATGTDAARYCIIRGGDYKTASNRTGPGTCVFKDGRSCSADQLYSGKC